MLKKDTLGAASPKSLVESFRCGECLHFRNHPHSTRQQVCIKEGVKPVAIAPRCFTPNVTLLNGNSDQFVALAALFHSYDAKQRRILLALLRSKKKEFAIGTKLYFKIGKDFISNYLTGYVAGYTSSGEIMLIGSPDRKTRGQSFVAYMSQSVDPASPGERAYAFLTVTQWKAKRASLREQNLIFDPSNRIIKRTSVVDSYEPPTIDAAPQMLHQAQTKAKRGPKRVADVVDQLSFTVS